MSIKHIGRASRFAQYLYPPIHKKADTLLGCLPIYTPCGVIRKITPLLQLK